ncbi:MAG: hypothetical protein JWO20_2337 [Candidatus Angelobacter sp.]|jgi:hypothetical protein|nr:hypothetical protein [Candidatus Angelobacter sp.]
MPPIKRNERRALEDYRDLKISLEELRPLIEKRVGIYFQPEGFHNRGIQKYTDPAVPQVKVRVGHLETAYRRWQERKISEKHLGDWAAMLTMNDDYVLHEDESEILAEWLNRVCFNGVIKPVIKA